MKIKKFAAALAAAAVLTVAAPITGVLPDVVSVSASAESSAQYKAGDTFGAAFDGEKWVIASDWMADELWSAGGAVWICTVLPDNTLSVHFTQLGAAPPMDSVTVLSQIAGYTVTAIDEGGIPCRQITIPDTVTTIGTAAFADDIYLEEVNFGANSQLKLIDQWAFQNCRSLKSITIPASVETIAYGAFLNIDFEGTNAWANSIYGDKYSLESVTFAEGSKLKTIGDFAFQHQESLKSITLPDSLNTIGEGAFFHCYDLMEIAIPANVSEIGVVAFSCNGDNVMSISKIDVDSNNQNFKSVDGVVLSKDGKTIVAYPAAKSGKYEIPLSVNNMAEGAFAHCTKLTSVTIPEGVTEIPENAFTYCTALSEVKLPSTLKTIGKWGFEATKLTSIDIPESVTSIDKQAFESSALKSINGVAGSYAETYAKENGYTFNGGSSDKPDDTSKPDSSESDTPNTFTDNSGDKAADIEVTAKPNVIPKEAYFSVRLDDKYTTAERIAYNCFFTYNGAEYEPTDTVTVKIPVPIAMRDIADTLKVYHLQDGKYVNMSAKVENGYLVFDTDHFSVYVVTAEDLANEGGSADTSSQPNTPDSSTTSASTPSTDDKGNPNTGVTAVAAVAGAAVLAGATVLIVRKKNR